MIAKLANQSTQYLLSLWIWHSLFGCKRLSSYLAFEIFGDVICHSCVKVPGSMSDWVVAFSGSQFIRTCWYHELSSFGHSTFPMGFDSMVLDSSKQSASSNIPFGFCGIALYTHQVFSAVMVHKANSSPYILGWWFKQLRKWSFTMWTWVMINGIKIWLDFSRVWINSYQVRPIITLHPPPATIFANFIAAIL